MIMRARAKRIAPRLSDVITSRRRRYWVKRPIKQGKKDDNNADEDILLMTQNRETPVYFSKFGR
jgi:hypothetical protein